MKFPYGHCLCPSNILKHREFDAALDHAAVTQILKAKTEPATPRIMHLLDRLSSYSFNLYYVKGRDMILADYLSRHRQPDKDPSGLIPISFCPMTIHMNMMTNDTLHIATHSNTKASGEAPPKVHGADKVLNPHVKPENQTKIPTSKKAQTTFLQVQKAHLESYQLSLQYLHIAYPISQEEHTSIPKQHLLKLNWSLLLNPPFTHHNPLTEPHSQSDHTSQLLVPQYNPAHPTRRMGRM